MATSLIVAAVYVAGLVITIAVPVVFARLSGAIRPGEGGEFVADLALLALLWPLALVIVGPVWFMSRVADWVEKDVPDA